SSTIVEDAASDQLEQIEGGGIERRVAHARLRGSDILAFTIKRRLRVGAGLLRLGKRDQPGRRQGGNLRATRLPLIRSAGGVPARWPNDITAVAAHIDAGADLACAVTNFDVGVTSENQMPAAARSDGRPSGRKRSALCDQLVERRLAVDLLGGIEVEIDRPYSARGTHWYADHGVGISLPPCEDLRFVSG